MDTSYDKFIRTTDDYHKSRFRRYLRSSTIRGIYIRVHTKVCIVHLASLSGQSHSLLTENVLTADVKVKPAKEEAYFFKMSKYANRLIEHINTHPEFIQPVSRKNEMMNNFLLPGLQDLCVSRTSFKWGIPVDFDDKHVVYVWLDALTNYITGIGYDADGNSSEQYKFWPADLHLIGKDIIRFHTIYWPIFLMALGEPLPKQVFGHPWLLQNDGKMSKSKGNVIYADDLVDMFGVDAVRYFVLHEMPFENDGVISWELIVERMNSDLANTLGNLVNRTIAMSNKYFGGVVNKTGVTSEGAGVDENGASLDFDADLKAVVTGTRDKVQNKMATLHVADAMTDVFALFKRCNKYIDETMPWALAKDESKKERLEEVLYNLVESITIGANLLKAFMPNTTESILKQLYPDNPAAGDRDFDDLDKFGLRESGNKVTDKPEILFARLDIEEVMKKVEELQEAQRKANGVPEYPVVEKKPEITFDDFEKIQIQVGEVLKCEPVKKAKKLLCSQIRIGEEVRQIVSGISQYYKPEEMVGKKVAVVTNLAPRKICGVESQGMILAAMDDKNNLSVMTVDKDIIAGSEIG